MSNLKRLKNLGLINPPSWLADNVCLEVIMGSVAYGVSNNDSDIDCYGFAIPPKRIVFPHSVGVIQGFDTQVEGFDQYQEHHILDKSSGKEYDYTMFGIVKYFRLIMENNPNITDSLFVPRRCIIHSTRVGEHVRENRKLFLHAGCYWKFKGYAFSQMHKIDIKKPKEGSKRHDSVAEHGMDVKFAYHVVRLLAEAEMILAEHDLDLERNREQLKSIRRGEWTIEQIKEHFAMKEKHLEELYSKTTLPHRPDEAKIKQILLECLELHYGSLSKAEIEMPDRFQDLLREIHRLSAV